jgi:hypothetical protein
MMHQAWHSIHVISSCQLSAQGRCNDIKLHPPPLQVSSHVAIEPVNEMNNVDSVSKFSDPGGRFAITNESVHYHHQSIYG